MSRTVRKTVVATKRLPVESFRMLGKKHCIAVLDFLSDAGKPMLQKDIEYDAVRSHIPTIDIMRALESMAWVERNEETRKYSLTKLGKEWRTYAGRAPGEEN